MNLAAQFRSMTKKKSLIESIWNRKAQVLKCRKEGTHHILMEREDFRTLRTKFKTLC